MLEAMATKAPAAVFYILAGLLGLAGLFTLLVPFIGIPLLVLGYCCYLIAGIAKRKAREAEVRRQLGG